MCAIRLRPRYTSMECVTEQPHISWNPANMEWGWSDEPYPIFLGINWEPRYMTDSVYPRYFVRKTPRVYRGVDEGEMPGAHDPWDNVNLTRFGGYEYFDLDKYLILVQAMEYDGWSSPTKITRILRASTDAAIRKLQEYNAFPAISKLHLVEPMKAFMATIIDYARLIPPSKVTRSLLAELREASSPFSGDVGQFFSSMGAVLKSAVLAPQAIMTGINPDDRVGDPQELRFSSSGKKRLTFSQSGEGKYIYKFVIYN